MKPKKKLLRTVKLKFFQDDANGEWGVTHSDTMQNHGSDGFNAFWDGRGIFHDVFEHAHEFVDKNFRGSNALNLGGEIAAMGQLWFFVNRADMYKRLDNPFLGYRVHPENEITIESTQGMMSEAIKEGYSNFGDVLECGVPNQKPVDNSELEEMIEEHFRRVERCEPNGDREQESEYGKAYKESVTLEKLANLYRYGYRMGQKLLGTNDPSRHSDTLHAFCTYFNDFCKANPAEELANYYREMIFRLYRDTEGNLYWKLEITPDRFAEGIETVTLEGGPGYIPTQKHVIP